MTTSTTTVQLVQPDLICFSHLRWNFVFQRPQHLMIRFARQQRVFFVEEPVFDSNSSRLDIREDHNVRIVVPHLPPGLSAHAIRTELQGVLAQLMVSAAIARPVLWYYTPMALPFSRDIESSLIVFDCMDELSAFRGAAAELSALEDELLGRADLVFTGGQSLFEAKRGRHPRVFAFPSSVDVSHFARARHAQADPVDQQPVPHPRLGFFGVIDERMDLALLDAVAAARPDWHLVMLGPCVKIDADRLPRRSNIHYLGMKRYDELPAYLSGWDVALLPFARNDATRFISPTKTPEYLAAGCRVVSTPIRDVVRPYGEQQLVEIADGADAFVRAIDRVLAGAPDGWQERVDRALSSMSWDRTWADMCRLLRESPVRRTVTWPPRPNPVAIARERPVARAPDSTPSPL